MRQLFATKETKKANLLIEISPSFFLFTFFLSLTSQCRSNNLPHPIYPRQLVVM